MKWKDNKHATFDEEKKKTKKLWHTDKTHVAEDYVNWNNVNQKVPTEWNKSKERRRRREKKKIAETNEKQRNNNIQLADQTFICRAQ